MNIDPVTVKHAVSLDKEHSFDTFTLNIENGDIAGMNAPLLHINKVGKNGRILMTNTDIQSIWNTVYV